MRVALIGTCLLLGACASQPSEAGRYQSLQQAFQAALASDTSGSYPAEMMPSLTACASQASVAGVPEDDQAQMLNALNTRQLTPSTDALFVKWFGRSMKHGRVVEPSIGDPATYAEGKAHYEDGTVAEDVPGAVTERLVSNAKQICPDLVRQYPGYFK